MARSPEQIGNILPELMARRGYARVQSAEKYDAVWREAAGQLVAEHTRVGALRQGRLEVVVAHSTLVQELVFQKSHILKTLSELLPEEGIKDLRFRVGSVD